MSALSGNGKISSSSASQTLGNSNTFSGPRPCPQVANNPRPPLRRNPGHIPIGPPYPSSRFFLSPEQTLVKRPSDLTSLTIADEDCYEVEEYKEYCLVGCFGGRFPGRSGVAKLVGTWPRRCRVFYRPNGFILFQFQDAEQRDAILNGPDQYVHGKKLFLRMSPEDGSLTIQDFCIKPIWITFPNLPRPLWHPNALSSITSMLGIPICMDPATLRRKMGAQARALVYIDTSVPPRTSIPITWNKGEQLVQSVTYEDRRDFCTTCDLNGHLSANCPKKECPPDQHPVGKDGVGIDSDQANHEHSGMNSGQLMNFVTDVPQVASPQPSCNSSPDKVISASSSHSAFGTLEAPIHSQADIPESQHPQDFSPADFAEEHEKLDFIHGLVPEGDLVRKKKKNKDKMCKHSKTKSDADTEFWPSADDSDEELEHLEDPTVQRKKKKLGKKKNSTKYLSDRETEATQPVCAKSSKGKKHGLVEIIFGAPSASHLVLPEPSKGAGGGGRRVPTFGGK